MKKTCCLITAVVVACAIMAVSAIATRVPKAEAASTVSSGTVSPDLLRRFESQLPAFPGQPVLPVLARGATLSAQAVQDMQVFYDPSGDNSTLACDLRALVVGYDPADSTYNFLVQFHAPFYGLGSRDSVDICIDVDKNASTGFRWTPIGLGSDYTILLEGSYSGWSATLVRTPSDSGSTWSIVSSLSGLQDTVDDAILVVVPKAYLGSPFSFNIFTWTYYDGIYDNYSDDLPNSGYVTYSRAAGTTTTTLAPTTTTTLAPTTTTTLAPTTTTTVPSTTTTTAPSGTQFSDVPSSHMYFSQIADLAGRKIISGFPNGTFQPDSFVTRQQFAKMIVKTMGYPVSEADVCPFIDVPSNIDPNDANYPDQYVAVCAAHGITVGTTPTSFDPYGMISRGQLITMVTRAAGIADPPENYAPPFAKFDETHYPFARKAAYAGLLNGLQGIGPGYAFFDPATRGEVCLVLYNLLHR